jgi:hypothetical protein
MSAMGVLPHAATNGLAKPPPILHTAANMQTAQRHNKPEAPMGGPGHLVV